MKTSKKSLLLLLALFTSLSLISAGLAAAQTFTTLYSFTATDPSGANSDGSVPIGGVILSSNILYGAAYNGGASGHGTVFAVRADGTGFATLHSFNGSNGLFPSCSLSVSGNILYGTTRRGGRSADGIVFAINTDGTGFTNLHSFRGDDGRVPIGGMALSGSILYGTTRGGGNSDDGRVFAINTDGTGFTNRHTFSGGDGSSPQAGLILSGETLYGTTFGGGDSNFGTVFKVNTDGTGFMVLHSFTATDPNTGKNDDGATPQAGLILSGHSLYGTANIGGTSGHGTVFAINTDGTGFTTLHSLNDGDGIQPFGGLIISGNTLYGTGSAGGSSGSGTVFALKTNGMDFTTLYSFTAFDNFTNSDGYNPVAGLVLLNNTLYATASQGGNSGWGTVFSLSLPAPQLTIVSFGANVVLTWPTNVAGFDYSGYTLQSTTNLGLSAVWTNNSPAPAVVNGQNTVTKPISGTEQFFRLSQ